MAATGATDLQAMEKAWRDGQTFGLGWLKEARYAAP